MKNWRLNSKFMDIDNSVCSSFLGCARRDLNDLIWLIWLFIFSLVSVSCLLSVFFFFAVIEWRIKLYRGLYFSEPPGVCCSTLYCSKGNYEFGLSRVIKSLEPYQKKLGTDTWYYAKRCFLSLIENMAKHMLMMQDDFLRECVQFLEACECTCYSKLPASFINHLFFELKAVHWFLASKIPRSRLVGIVSAIGAEL